MSRAKTGSNWVGVECAQCGRECTAPEDADSFAWYWAEEPQNDTIECARGHGCSRRRDRDERFEGRAREYRFEGYWYTAAQLAALFELPTPLVQQRLRSGWTAEDAGLKSVKCPLGAWEAQQRSRRAVILAGGVGDESTRAAMAREARPEWKRGPGKVSKLAPTHGRSALTLEAVATVCHFSIETVRALARKLGSLDAVVMHKAELIKAQRRRATAKKKRAGLPTAGRPPVLEQPVAVLAVRTGLTRQGLWKAAKRNGRTTAEEIAARLAEAANDTKEVAA